MAIALHGTVSTGMETTGSAGTLTISHTINTGTDLVLYVGIIVDTNSDVNPTVTWNGSAMTLVGEIVGSGSAQHVAVFRTIAPATGTHDAVFTWGNSVALGVVSCYSGVHQTTPNDTPVTVAQGSVTSISSNVTSESGDLVLDFVGVNSNPTLTVGAGQTELVNVNVPIADDSPGGTMGGASSEPGAGTVTMSWSFSASSSRTGRVCFNVNLATTTPTSLLFSGQFFGHLLVR